MTTTTPSTPQTSSAPRNTGSVGQTDEEKVGSAAEEIPRPELTEAARRAEERAKEGKPTRAATREPSMVSLERAADEGMIPAKDDE